LNHEPDAYKAGYDKFESNTCKSNTQTFKIAPLIRIGDEYPDGWPRVAAFLEECDSFGIYRMFGQSHARLLVIHMSNITALEKQLLESDKSDKAGGGENEWRLYERYEAGQDTTKKVLLESLEKEILAYGKNYMLDIVK